MQQSHFYKYLSLSILAFGVNFGFTFHLLNLSSLFQLLGGDPKYLSLFWIIPPVTGFVIQPIIGSLSDISRTRTRYILGWGILTVIAFLLLPIYNSIFYLMLLTLIIDCSLNGAIETIRALTGDLFSSEPQRIKVFALQAIFSGVGGMLGASLPFLTNSLLILFFEHYQVSPGVIPLNLKLSFIMAAFISLFSLLLGLHGVGENKQLINSKKTHLLKNLTRGIQSLCYHFKSMSTKFKKIFIVHSLTWVSVFTFWLYFSVMLAQNTYLLPVKFDVNHESHLLIHQVNIDSSFYNTIYQVVSMIYASLLFIFSKQVNSKVWHGISLLIGGLGMTIFYFEHSFWFLCLSSIAVGIMWGSIIVLPYTIIMESIPKETFGTYLGIFNMSITAPQIVCAFLLSPVYVFIFKQNASFLLFFAGCLVILSAFLWLHLSIKNEAFANQ